MRGRVANGGDGRALLALAPAGILVGLFGVDSVLAAAAGWRPGRSRIEMFAVGAATLAAAVIALAVLLSPARRWVANHAGALMTIQLASLLALGIGEGALGLLGERVTRTPFHGHPRGLREVFEPKIAGTSPRARFSVNSLGLRGPELPADPRVYRIVAVGGSTTEDVYLDDEATWTRLLMADLNAAGGRRFWVASAGRSGFATVEHLAFVENSELLEDVDAVLLLVGINDLARMVWGETADRVLRPPSPRWTRLRTVELVKRVASAWAPGNLVMDRDALFVHDAQEARHQAKVVEGEIATAPYLAAYGERLRAIVEACRRRHLVLVLADQPTLFRSSLSAEEEKKLWLLRRRDGSYLPPRVMRRLMDEYNQVTGATARRFGVPLVRLSDLDGQDELFYDDCHFSEAGARAVARRIAAGVPWQTLMPRRRS